MIEPRAIAAHFIAACRAELAALKPGNVHAHAGGHTMEVADFEKSAVAAAPAIADPGLGVGARILGAVTATWAEVGTNTNLGIVLLCAPLAKAAEQLSSVSAQTPPSVHPAPPARAEGENLRHALRSVLDDLTIEDAAGAFAAIAKANPAGLGRADAGDVAAPATMTLREAMALAAGRDRIALAYGTGYADIFDFALPAYERARRLAATPDLAVTTLHMSLLAALPDSHIARKHGPEAAIAVQRDAKALLPALTPVATAENLPALLSFDAGLKARRLNPGTTADFVVATVFASLLTTEIAGRDPS